MNKLGFGVIGIKGFGAFHLEAVKHNKRAEVRAVCDIDEEAAKKKAEEYGLDKYYVDYNDMFADPAVDAVIIATPDQLHREMTVAALKAGKNVLCEKPLALHNDDCAAMLKAWKESGKYLMVGQECRCAPAFILAKKIYDSGEIGDLYFLESEYAHDYSEMNCPWRKNKENPRHPVTGGGCHAIDLLRWFAGNPTEAFAYSNHKALSDEWPLDDSAIAVLKFDNDVMGKVYVSTGCKRNYTMRTVIYGTKGTIICDNTSSAMSVFLDKIGDRKDLFGAPLKVVEMKIPVDISNHNVDMELEEFCKNIFGEDGMDISGNEGAATVAIAEAIIESSAKGAPVRIDYSFMKQ